MLPSAKANSAAVLKTEQRMPKAATNAIAMFSLALALDCDAVAGDISAFNTIETASPTTIERIRISDPKFKIRSFVIQRSGGLESPIISFTVLNESSVTIQKMYFTASLSIKGRFFPLAVQNFSVPIYGGLQPHERKRVDLDADIYGDWKNVAKRDVRNAAFRLTLEAVDDAKGDKIVK